MPNEKNLVSIADRTTSEQREIQSAGGKASGAARRRKRALKEAADLFLSLPIKDKRRRSRLEKMGLAPDDIDNQMEMIVGLQEAAAHGDSRAAKLLVEILGENSELAASRQQEEEAMRANMQALADVIQRPVPNRDIKDFEE